MSAGGRRAAFDVALFADGFRPFFLLCGGYAAAGVAAWWWLLAGGGWPGAPADPLLWHQHELSIGFVGAAIAGFLLTAVPVWTGLPAPRGGRLAVLAGAWLAGRSAAAFGADWPPLLVAALELWFPLQLAAIVTRLLIAAGNRRNYPLAAVVALLPLADLGYHLGVTGVWPGAERVVSLLPHIGALLIVVIGGRIIPAFTGNWLRARGGTPPRRRPLVEAAALASTAAVALSAWSGSGGTLAGALACAAAAAHGLRLAGWRGLQTRREPLLAVLHLGYLWLPVGYALLALYGLGWAVPRSAALHALTVGALGTMIVAVMSRVALAHSGRPLRAARPTVLAYGLVTLAALTRVLAPFGGAAYTLLLDAAALAWCLAWGLFLWVYAPILVAPRPAGRG